MSDANGNGAEPEPLNAIERAAINKLERLAKTWPDSLRLFSWSGSLKVMKGGPGVTYGSAVVASISIPNDGGDPDHNELAPEARR
jgi:hypothetical protein